MFLTVRRHAGNSRPGTGSVVRCEWRFQFSLIRENQCGGREHVITLKSDNSSVWLNRAEMSPEAAGIAACLMTYSHHACRTECYAMTVHYYRLRDYALQHPECSAIMRIID
ncbi:TPA: antirestriction protein [Escherichia coli]|nr:antirestriction protein [Escherichia coli]HAJ7094055.1 antirestriction protein [Escherichia coli]